MDRLDINLWPAFIIIAVICGVIGWGIIEGILWIINHIDIIWTTAEASSENK